MGEKKNRDKQNGVGHHNFFKRAKNHEKRSIEVAKEERKKKLIVKGSKIITITNNMLMCKQKKQNYFILSQIHHG
jgi:hypothetical protein